MTLIQAPSGFGKSTLAVNLAVYLAFLLGKAGYDDAAGMAAKVYAFEDGAARKQGGVEWAGGAAPDSMSLLRPKGPSRSKFLRTL